MRPHEHDTIANRKQRGRLITPGRFAIAALSAIAIALALPSPASAQPALWATSPEDGAALDAAPGEIAVTYSEALDASVSEVVVTGPDQAPIELEPFVANDNVLIQPMRYTVPGAYTITISAVFEDGQRLDDSFTFSVESIADVLSADGDAPDASSSDSAAAATADGSETSIGTIVGVALLAALVVATGGILLARRSARRRSADQ